jgi:hypothetical protein
LSGGWRFFGEKLKITTELALSQQVYLEEVRFLETFVAAGLVQSLQKVEVTGLKVGLWIVCRIARNATLLLDSSDKAAMSANCWSNTVSPDSRFLLLSFRALPLTCT